MEAYENATSSAARSKYVPWEQKTINKLFWRGSSTGDSYSVRKNYDWRRSHRPRLHLMMQNETGDAPVWVKRGREWSEESWSVAKLNEVYMDVGLAGKPHQVGVLGRVSCVSINGLTYGGLQCKEEDGTCAEMASEIKFKDRVAPEDAAKYKCEAAVRSAGY